MKAEDLKSQLNCDLKETKVVIPIQIMGDAVGGHPFVEVETISFGFDWDAGKLFIHPAMPVHLAGEKYDAEKQRYREMSDALGSLWLIMSSRSYDQKQKLAAVRRTLKQFGLEPSNES